VCFLKDRDYEKIVMEKIVLIAVLILVLGVFFFSLTNWQFMGEILISGGFVGIVVYFIVGEHSDYVMREKHLGIGKGVTLLEEIFARSGHFTKYEYEKREFVWELIANNSPKWSSKLTDKIHLRVNQPTDHITFERMADERLLDRVEPAKIKEATSTFEATVYPELVPDLSIPTKKYFRLMYDFQPDHEYLITMVYEYPQCMDRSFDYIYMLTPVLTRKCDISIQLPNDFDAAHKTIECYVMDLRSERVRTLHHSPPRANRIAINNCGPVNEGETILFKYKQQTPQNTSPSQRQ